MTVPEVASAAQGRRLCQKSPRQQDHEFTTSELKVGPDSAKVAQALSKIHLEPATDAGGSVSSMHQQMLLGNTSVASFTVAEPAHTSRADSTAKCEICSRGWPWPDSPVSHA